MNRITHAEADVGKDKVGVRIAIWRALGSRELEHFQGIYLASC